MFHEKTLFGGSWGGGVSIYIYIYIYIGLFVMQFQGVWQGNVAGAYWGAFSLDSPTTLKHPQPYIREIAGHNLELVWAIIPLSL